MPIYEVGECDGQHYFSMGFVDGPSPATSIADGPMPQREAAQLVQVVADAVQFAHEHGIIHRDLKPANILVDQNGQPRITDFGLAKRLEDGGGQTTTGRIMGTPSYMSPEQAAGKTEQIGPQTDVYSLGAILYELLTGRPPFRAVSVWETVSQVIEQEPVSACRLNASIGRERE